MAATQIGNADVLFGIVDGSLGFFESLTFEEAGETVEILDGCGQIISAFLTGDRTNVSGTFVLDTTATGPNRGDTITLGTSPQFVPNGDIYITAITEEYSNSDALKVSFEGTFWPFI